jgi:AraC-like DNA-binding protein
MPKSNLRPEYCDPFTPLGTRLGREEALAFHLHEAGCLTLSTQWNHPGVRSPFWRLYWNNRPGAWIDCSGRRFNLKPDRFLVVPAHVAFDTHGSLRPVVHFWIHFSLHPDLTVKDGLPLRLPCRKGLARQVTALARQVGRPKPAATRQLYHLCSALLHQVFADSATEAHPPRLPSRLLALLHEIESSLARPIPVTQMAFDAGMSRGGFIRWFRQHLEVTPARYVLSRRIDHACRLLKFSTASIEEISEKTGFANRSHFSRAFRKQMGSGPAFFRKN